MSLAINIQCRGARVAAESDGAVLMRYAGKRYALSDEEVSREQALMAAFSMNGAF